MKNEMRNRFRGFVVVLVLQDRICLALLQMKKLPEVFYFHFSQKERLLQLEATFGQLYLILPLWENSKTFFFSRLNFFLKNNIFLAFFLVFLVIFLRKIY